MGITRIAEMIPAVRKDNNCQHSVPEHLAENHHQCLLCRRQVISAVCGTRCLGCPEQALDMLVSCILVAEYRM